MTPPPVDFPEPWNGPPELVEWIDEHPDLMRIEVDERTMFTYVFKYDGEAATVAEVTTGKCFGCGSWTWIESGETMCCGATWEDVKLIDSYNVARDLAEWNGEVADHEDVKEIAEQECGDDLVNALDDPETRRALREHYERHFRSFGPNPEGETP